MNNFFQWIVSALQNFYDKWLPNSAALHLLFLENTKTSVSDPILKLELSEKTSVYDQKLHKLRSRISERSDRESFTEAKNFLPTNVVERWVFPVMVCLAANNVAYWRYLRLKNPIFFLFWNSCVTQSYQITAILRNCFLKVQTITGLNKIKIHCILLEWERFVGGTFFELNLAFYPRDLMCDPHKLWKFERNWWDGMCHAFPALSLTHLKAIFFLAN